MSTANKLTYLSTTKGKIKDSINLTGANIGNNDTFRSYSAKLRDGLVDAINDNCETLYNNFPKVTGTGNNITLNNTYEAPMRVNLKGNTYQYRTTGKNLLPFPYQTSDGTINGLTFTTNTDGSLTISGTSTAETIFGLYTNTSKMIAIDTTKNYILSERPTNSDINLYYYEYYNNTWNYKGASSTGSLSFTPSSQATGQLFRILIGNNKTINATFNIQLEEGSTATSYEPYTGGIPSPNPSYPQNIETVTGYNEIKICGKNLLNKDGGFDKGYYNASGVWVNENVTCCLKNTPVKENTTYTYSTNTITRNKTVVFFDNSNTFIGRTQTQNNIKDYTFTTPANTRYARLMFVAVGTPTITQTIIDDLNIQLEQGPTATTYEPYQEQSYEINLGKNLINDTLRASAVNNVYIGVSTTTDTFNLKAGTYTLSTNVSCTLQILDSSSIIHTSSSETTSFTFTLSSETGIRVRLQKIGIVSSDVEWVQLEKGTSSTSYSEYFTPIELCKIGDYQDEIRKSTGKNLFDEDNANILDDTYLDQYSIRTSTGTKLLYISCKPNTTYTISKIVSSRFRVATTNVIPEASVSTYGYITNDTGTTVTITTNSTAKYLCVYYKNTSDTLTTQQILDSIQIEEGSTATDLEPYGTGIWYKYAEIGKVVLDGSENNWQIWSQVTLDNTILCGTPIIDNLAGEGYIGYSNYFKNSPVTLWNVDEEGMQISAPSATTKLRFRINKNIASNLNSFKTWLSTHNLIVYYPLATPTIEVIEDTTLINQLNALENAKGYNNQTNVIAEYMSGNQPIIMGVSALLKEE